MGAVETTEEALDMIGSAVVSCCCVVLPVVCSVPLLLLLLFERPDTLHSPT